MFVVTGHPHLDTALLFVALKILAYTVIVPLVLAIILLAFAATLLDFTWFRFRTALARKRHPKDVWEF